MVVRIARVVRERLRDESGMALVMAIGVSMVIAIMGASLVLYSTSNEKIANRSKGDLRAYQLAQSGIDSAASVIAQTPVTNGRQNAAIFSSLTTAQRTLTFGAGESVVYNGTLYDDTPGTVTGTPLVWPYRWVLTATSAVPNPNAGGPSVTRTVTATMLLSPRAPATTIQSQAWKYVYSKGTDNVVLTCDVTLPNNSDYSASFYTNGTLCLTGTGDILGNGGSGPPIEVIAKGGIWVNAVQSYIGLGNPVNRVETPVNGCKYRANAAGACTVARHVTAVAGGIIAPSTTTVAAPTTSFSNTAALASPGPGPGNNCQGKPSGSYPDFASMTLSSTFDLTGGTYTCKTNAGELSYDSAARVLTVRGLIYFPGNLVANGNVAVRYQGIAAIYVAGTYQQAQVALCAAISGSSCDYANWDTTNNVLLIAAAGGNVMPSPCTGAALSFTNQTQFQGAVYADGTKNVCARNSTTLQGPSVANLQDFDNSIVYQPMPTTGIVKVPFGAPGQTTPVSDYDVTSPINYTG